jgi:hypothetical protein
VESTDASSFGQKVRSGIGRLRVTSLHLLVALFILLALVSVPIISSVRGALGLNEHPLFVSASFIHPGHVDEGLIPGELVQIAVKVSKPTFISWSASWPSTFHFDAHLDAAFRAKRPGLFHFDIPLDNSRDSVWLTVKVRGVKLPLRAWIK